jgi:hypothetical protein
MLFLYPSATANAITSSVVTPAAGVDEVQFVPSDVRTLPLVPTAVNPVPPFAAASVPASVISPVVPVFGVNPVDPALKLVTAAVTAVVHTKAEPFHFKNVSVTVGAVKKSLAPEPVLYTILFAAPPATLVALAAVPDIEIPQVPVAPVPSV